MMMRKGGCERVMARRLTLCSKTTLKALFLSGLTRYFSKVFPNHCAQTDEVLSKASDEDLKKGLNPGPLTEIKFWDAKVAFGGEGELNFCPQCTNLESLFEQMKADLTRKMASILNVTDSAYYPCFKSVIILPVLFNPFLGPCSEMLLLL